MVKENTVKKFLPILSLLCLFSLGSCTRKEPAHSPVTPPSENEVTFAEDFTVTSSVLVVYFSKTHTTENVALSIRELTDADLFQIERKEPYPEAYTPTTEVAQEEKNSNARPELSSYLPKDVVARYDTVFVGFPIWWHTAPLPVLSFLNFYDWTGQTIYTFCTAASSPITESTEDIRSNAEGATVIKGKRFSRNDSGIETWIHSLNLPESESA